MDDDKRCAPSKKYTDGSCFTIESLKLIASKYNDINNNKIIISDNKKQLIEQLKKKMSSTCSNQTCWLRTDLLKEIDDKEIHNNTFRPDGPKSKYAWLSTININDVINQYHSNYQDFLFLGTVPYDFQEIPELGLENYNFQQVYNQNIYKLGLVINLDSSHQSGSHWVALYTDLKKKQIYFFDSVGKPPKKKIKKFINKITNFLYYNEYKDTINIGNVLCLINNLSTKKLKKKYLDILSNKLKIFDIRFNNIQHQFKNTECGVYSINFILRLLKGETFDNIINNITDDDKINKCREIYFLDS